MYDPIVKSVVKNSIRTEENDIGKIVFSSKFALSLVNLFLFLRIFGSCV